MVINKIMKIVVVVNQVRDMLVLVKLMIVVVMEESMFVLVLADQVRDDG